MRISFAGAKACALTLACALLASTSAIAAPSMSFESASLRASNSDTSPDMAAGGHPFALTTAFKLVTTLTSEGRLVAQGGDPADVQAQLPPGVALDPSVVPACDSEEFATYNSGTGEDGCHDASAVGVAEIENVKPATLAERVTTRYPIYRLVPAAGTPALFGFMTAAGAVYLTPSIRTASDYGLTVAMTGIPQSVHLLGSAVTLWGAPADSAHDSERGHCVKSHASCSAGVAAKALLTLPTQCSVAPDALLSTDSWQERGTFAAIAHIALSESSAPLQDCEALAFSPTVSVAADSEAASAPSALTIDLGLPAAEDPSTPAGSQIDDYLVRLPSAIKLNLARVNGLASCPLHGAEGINLGSSEPAHCPTASRIGTVRLATPLSSEDLEGGIYAAEQGNLPSGGSNPFGTLLALYLVAEGAGVVVKLPAEMVTDPQTGQLMLHLGPDPITGQATLPQLSFTDIKIELEGGARAAIVTPPDCGDYTATSSLTPSSGTSPAVVASDLHFTQQCAKPFSPSFAAATSTRKANGFTQLAVTLTRADSEQELRDLSATLPEGMLAVLGGVELCPEPQASLGTCGAASLIGHVTATLGVGAEPVELTGGRAYFTAPYGGGPFGMSLVLPATSGQFNLGPGGRPVVLRAAIHVNSRTGNVTISTDAEGAHAIPNLLQGLAPEVKALKVVIDRPEFMFNPSGCQSQQFTGTAASVQGATAGLAVPYSSAECSALPFGPKLTASVVGKPSRTNGIGFYVKIVEGYKWESNAHFVKVELPKQLPSRATTLQKACKVAIFEANPAQCAAGSVIGTVSAVTSSLPVRINGPVYLVGHGGAKFPEVVMVLQGYGVTIYVYGETFISKAGITSTTFENVPDAPIPLFEMHLPAGPGSILSANGDLCASQLHIPTELVAYNGLTVKESPRIAVPGCRPRLTVVRHKLSGGRLRVVLRVPSAGRLLASGRGIRRATRAIARAGTVQLNLRVTAHGTRRAHKLRVKLTFAPKHGSRLTTQLTVLVR
ncbi:MAG TPA: hypothetical protein VGY30_00300 [Solirubrobacteraceae bacterium]|jgi:hypothetical protein|nr:hypothetical protein [Solirubrobacteraceae bacterium]